MLKRKRSDVGSTEQPVRKRNMVAGGGNLSELLRVEDEEATLKPAANPKKRKANEDAGQVSMEVTPTKKHKAGGEASGREQLAPDDDEKEVSYPGPAQEPSKPAPTRKRKAVEDVADVPKRQQLEPDEELSVGETVKFITTQIEQNFFDFLSEHGIPLDEARESYPQEFQRNVESPTQDEAIEEHERMVHDSVNSFLHTQGLVSHHLESYELFLQNMLPEIIAENSTVTVENRKAGKIFQLFFRNIYIAKPTMREADGTVHDLTPEIAILRGLTYSFDMFAEMHYKYYRQNPDDPSEYVLQEYKIIEEIPFCKIPCMVGSSACHTFGQGSPTRTPGTFIIMGNQKVVISLETLRTNFTFVKHPRIAGKFVLEFEMRSLHPTKIRSTSTACGRMTGPKDGRTPKIMLEVPFIKKVKIPIAVVFRMIGVGSLQDMLKYICLEDASDQVQDLARMMLAADDSGTSSRSTIEELCKWIFDQKPQAFDTRKQPARILRDIRNVFLGEFIPHCLAASSFEDPARTTHVKAVCFGACIRKMLRVALHEQELDEIDACSNKRCQTTGFSFALWLRQSLIDTKKTVNTQIYRRSNPGRDGRERELDPVACWKGHAITQNLHSVCNTGNWGRPKQGSAQTGLCQLLQDTSIAAKLSHLRCISLPVSKEGHCIGPRQLGKSQLGVYCSVETPDSKAVGLVRFFAFLCCVRLGIRASWMIDIMTEDMDLIPDGPDVFEPKVEEGTVPVLINGVRCGVIRDAAKFLRLFRLYKQYASIPSMASAVLLNNQLLVNVDAGAYCRPVFRVDRLHLFRKVWEMWHNEPEVLWTELLVSGVVEYVSKEMELDLRIAMSYEEVLREQADKHQRCPPFARPIESEFTHLEVHAVYSICGVTAATIVLGDQNQSPRNMYQVTMIKQSATEPHLEQRPKKAMHLWYPQRSAVVSKPADLVLGQDSSGGMYVNCLVMPFPKGQEDSLIINKRSKELGLFRTAIIQTFKECEGYHGTEEESIEPAKENGSRRKRANVDFLDRDGIVRTGAKIPPGTRLVNKTVEVANPVGGKAAKLKHDRSLDYRGTGDVSVTEVIVTPSTAKPGLKRVLVVTQSTHEPEEGDKYASRHGQKGVLGEIRAHEDMPYDLNGETPDIIVNSLAFPSRMTLGHIFEKVLGEIAALLGEEQEGSMFTHRNMPLEDLIKHFGKKRVMMDPMTGRMMEEPVFMGRLMYQRLKQVAEDKIHARDDKGPNQSLTRQPVEGRSREGGFRMGEMEVNAVACHGASATMQERMLFCADKYVVDVCNTCGAPAEPKAPPGVLNPLHHKPFCRGCWSHDNIVKACMPYAAKLLWQELGGCHIDMKLTIEPSKADEMPFPL